MKITSDLTAYRTRLAMVALFGFGSIASAATYNWNTTSGTWDSSTANWTGDGSTWTNGSGNIAVFSNTATASTITLGEALVADKVKIGNGGNNANFTFTNGVGGSLSAATLTFQGNGGNDLSTNPTSTLNNASITVSGDIGVGRTYLVIGGTSTVSADRIGGAGMLDIASADWGTVTIQDSANVTATNGIVGGTTAWGLNLNGGTLTTKGINYGPHSYLGTTNLNFNGTLVKANQDNSNFITVSGGLDFVPVIQSGGAKIDSNGFTIGIGVTLSGSGALTKSGTGTLNLNTANSYTGGTVINGGTLSLNHEPFGIANTAIGAMTASNQVTINNGGTLTGTANNWLSSTSSASGGSNAITVVVNAGGTLKGGNSRITGLGNVTLNGGTIEVGSGLGAFGWNGAFTLAGDITVTGSSAAAITTTSGADTSANIQMSNGSNGVGGTRTFTVNDVTSSTASDLIVSARLSDGTVIKAGAGTLELAAGATGTGTAVNWQVTTGKLHVNSTVSTGNVTLASGATLGGSGSVGTLSVTGIVAPGNSIGTLNAGQTTWVGAASASPSTDWQFELGASNTSDKLVITGDFLRDTSVGSQFRFDFMDSTQLGTFRLITWSGSAASWSLSDFTYDTTSLGAGRTGYFTFNSTDKYLDFTVVPELSNVLIGGLIGLGLMRRQRKSSLR